MDAVTEVLLDRARAADTVSRMVVLSLILHGLAITAVTVLPRQWASPAPDNRRVMVISLAGAPGPIQGRNPISAKPVQEAVPETAKPKNEAPPALSKPEMIEPVKSARPEPKAARAEPKKEEPQLHGRTPTKGVEVKQGSARVETHSTAQTQFGGLATGGGGVPGAYTDYADFCCPEYLQQMTRMIYGNWQQRQGQDGSNIVKFTIRRDGTITDVQVEQGANQFLNLASQRALAVTRQLPPLPAAFTGDHLNVHLVFQYKR